MADHVYRRFTNENLFSTTILAQNRVIVSSGSAGWTGNTNLGTNAMSLYGGVRSRADVGVSGSAPIHIYPLDQVDTQSIDGVIQIPGEYPQTGSINIVWCTNTEQPDVYSSTDSRWYDQAHSVVRRLSDWYRSHTKQVYPSEDDFYHIGTGSFTPSGSFTCFHIPSMFYGRNIATGTVALTVNSFAGAPFGYDSTGTIYWVDDGIGRIWQVPSLTSSWQSGTSIVGNVFYNEGLIVFTHPDWRWHQLLLSSSLTMAEPHISLQFDGSYHIKSMLAMCRMNPADVNASNNPTYYITDETGKRWARDWEEQTEAITYVTAVGIYNEERQLVAVAKIAQPIRKRERDDIDIKLRMDL